MTAAVVKAVGDRTDNAQLIVDCHRLGFFPGTVLDATYGLGRMWRAWRPADLVTVDLCRPADVRCDFRRLPFRDKTFDTVVFDPPYKLNGTSTGVGPSALDDGYGVGGGYMSTADRHRLIHDGITGCGRVSAEWLLVKCQDQVSSGKVQWQTRLFADAIERSGFVLFDSLHVVGCRPQPSGRRQLHARRDYSTLLVGRRTR